MMLRQMFNIRNCTPGGVAAGLLLREPRFEQPSAVRLAKDMPSKPWQGFTRRIRLSLDVFTYTADPGGRQPLSRQRDRARTCNPLAQARRRRCPRQAYPLATALRWQARWKVCPRARHGGRGPLRRRNGRRADSGRQERSSSATASTPAPDGGSRPKFAKSATSPRRA